MGPPPARYGIKPHGTLSGNKSMRDRGIVLDPYLDHGVLARVCQEVGVPVEELDPSGAGRAQVKRSYATSVRSFPLVGKLVA